MPVSAIERLALALLFALPAMGQPVDAPGPLEIDLEEHVDVKLVLIDAVVLDAGGKTVPDLAVEDFDLLIDNKDVAIETFDVDCPLGAAPDPPVGATRPQALAHGYSTPRRYVFVIDYYHPGATIPEVLDGLREAIGRLHVPGEEYMLISLGQVLRIEVPFTDDVEELLHAIDRMYGDPDLYFGFYDRLTERRWFKRILTMLDLLEQMPGQKAVVLFSGPFLVDGWTYDELFWEIAAMSAGARSTFYPIDGRGLVLGSSVLGPPKLQRLADETGGRMTAATNDLARGFARAQRDQGCRYTLGFYDHRPRYDKERKVRVFVRRTGRHVAHSTYYVVRSDDRKQASLRRTASMIPGLFSGEGLSSELVAIRPRSGKRWNALAAVEVDGSILVAAPKRAAWTVTGTLRRPNGTIHQRFERTLVVPEDESASEPSNVVLFAELRPRPGRYSLNVVASNPEIVEPWATTREVVVPGIPKNELFMIGPTLGRASVVVSADAAVESEIEPLMRPATVRGAPLASLTSVCFVGKAWLPVGNVLRRAVTTAAGTALEFFDPVKLELDGTGSVRCQSQLDSVATLDLEPGEYGVEASMLNGEDSSRSGASFSVVETAP